VRSTTISTSRLRWQFSTRTSLIAGVRCPRRLNFLMLGSRWLSWGTCYGAVYWLSLSRLTFIRVSSINSLKYSSNPTPLILFPFSLYPTILYTVFSLLSMCHKSWNIHASIKWSNHTRTNQMISKSTQKVIHTWCNNLWSKSSQPTESDARLLKAEVVLSKV